MLVIDDRISYPSRRILGVGGQVVAKLIW